MGANYLAAGLSGCGPVQQQQKEEPTGVATMADLMACTEATAWRVVFVGEQKKFYMCDGVEWQAVTLGEQGEQGEAGPRGNTGAQGAVGQQGEQGVAGAQGATGQQGVQGNTGPQGGGASARHRMVFITAGMTSGTALQGLQGADDYCNDDADDNGPAVISGKSFKAWLSDSSGSPSTRFAKDGDFLHLDGTLLAASWDDLASESRFDGRVQGNSNTAPVWFNTMSDGTYDQQGDCDQWGTGVPSNNASVFVATTSYSGPLLEQWTSYDCGDAARILCVEE